MKASFGRHDAEAYLAALQSGKRWEFPIQIVGRYGFDPTPILQAQVDQPRDAQYGPGLFTVFGAACRSDLVDDHFARVDWNDIAAREVEAGYNARPLEFVQAGYFPRHAKQNDC